jgi:predicted permease
MWREIRQAFRALLRAPGFAVLTVVTPALGIGAACTLFAIGQGLLRPLPYPESERLVRMRAQLPNRGASSGLIGGTDAMAILQQQKSFAPMAAFLDGSWILTTGTEPDRVLGTAVTPGFFELFGAWPALGKPFDAAAYTMATRHQVILSHETWVKRFGGDPGIVGREIQLDARPHRVVGVMREGFRYPVTAEMWFPSAADAPWLKIRYPMVNLAGRLRAGVTLDQGLAELNQLTAELGRPFGREETFTLTGRWLLEDQVGHLRTTGGLFLAAVAALLLISCANTANLLLARAVARDREIAVRRALGAPDGSLAKLLLSESVLLALAAGVLGLGLAWGALRLLLRFEAGLLPRAGEMRLDWGVAAFALVATGLSAVLFGSAPLWHGLKPAVADVLRSSRGSESVGAARFRRLVLVAQLMLATVLLAGSGWLVMSLRNLLTADAGFRSPEQVLTMEVPISDPSYRAEPAKARQFFRTLIHGAAQLPGVERVGAVNILPLGGYEFKMSVKPLSGGTPVDVLATVAAPGYFAAIGIPVRAGRAFEWTDHEQSPDVCVISESLARRLSGSAEAALGTRLQFPGWGRDLQAEVVGVVADVRHNSLSETGLWQVYAAHAQVSIPGLALVVRTSRPAAEVVPGIRALARELDPQVPVVDAKWMSEWVDRAVQAPRFRSLLVTLFAGLAVVLAAFGIYSLLAYTVEQRHRELGVRLALGATPGALVGQMMREGVRLAAWGIAAGTGLAWFGHRFVADLLYTPAGADVLLLVGVAAGLLVLAATATWGPALRAGRAEPATALRAE